ncbi:MAG: hypothetical protein ACRCR2_06500 [Fusobacteriaceae bacterium]
MYPSQEVHQAMMRRADEVSAKECCSDIYLTSVAQDGHLIV